jgi:NAD(P)-dependent dehydrogenase (short-subunit alcohol dehydrogenase family)
VVVNDLGCRFDGAGESHSMADAVVDEIVAAGGKAVASYDSVATPEGGEAIVRKALDAFDSVDVLINNAGTLRNADFDQLSDDTIDEMISVHLKGAFNVTRPAYRKMKQQRYGRVVFASSAAGMLGNEQQAAYGAAKAGLVGLMNVLSLEGAPYNVKCNALLPTAQSRMGEAMAPGLLEKSASVFAKLGDKLGNTSNPDFVTPLVTYLASETCDSSHAIYSAALGRYARVFLGVCPGWVGPRDKPASADDIAAHFSEICDLQGYKVPGYLLEEFEHLAVQMN